MRKVMNKACQRRCWGTFPVLFRSLLPCCAAEPVCGTARYKAGQMQSMQKDIFGLGMSQVSSNSGVDSSWLTLPASCSLPRCLAIQQVDSSGLPHAVAIVPALLPPPLLGRQLLI